MQADSHETESVDPPTQEVNTVAIAQIDPIGERVLRVEPEQLTEGLETPVAGDLVYYNAGGRGQDHIAIYLNEQEAIHGNWNGTMEEAGNSAIGALDLGMLMQYIHVNG